LTSAFTGNKSIPEIGYSYDQDFPVAIIRYAGVGTEQRATRQTIHYRRYAWPMRKTAAERALVDTFFRIENYQVNAFYLRDPRDNARTGVSLGTSVSGQTAFSLPSSGENLRDYPISTATATVYDDGVATTSTVTWSEDRRVAVLSTSPTSGSVMTADYHYYRKVRLQGTLSWKALAPDFYEASPEFWEVPA